MYYQKIKYNEVGDNMAITKTKFINYIRCPRYVSLDDLKKEKLNSMVSIEEYKKEEESEQINEILENMFDEKGNDIIDVTSDHLKTMMPYYKEVELLAGKLASNYFSGTFRYSKETYNQESFDCLINNIRYLCYVDIYNENKDGINIIEAKATTTKKYLDLAYKENSIFKKDQDGIYKLLEDLNENIEDIMPKEAYERNRDKLLDKYTSQGHYVYDLAVQRFIIENDLRQNNIDKKIKYYLAVLNSNYVFDGTYENENPIYKKTNNEDIISYIDLTNVTEDLMDKIKMDAETIENYIDDLKVNSCPLGPYCEYKKSTKCKFTKICFNILPEKHSILSYIDNHHGFKSSNKKYTTFDLINQGKVKMLDIDEELLNRKKNIIQRNAVLTNTPYIDKNKIKAGLNQLKYPIYHLDFETFPCPLPRYKGEKPYTQSVFQFSLHIEKTKGICDKEKDHYGYLAKNQQDHRLELVKLMCELIKDDGTVLVYNDAFEKTRIKELSQIFPEYKAKLLKIRSNIFDLMNIVKTNSKLYESLNYSKEEAKMFNYYHPDMDGSYSIKKVLPVLSNLTYKNMEIGNGIEALITYAKFGKLLPKDYNHKYQKLIEYCQQDTYAMYKVLEGLRNIVK